MPLVGWILVAMGLFSVGGVLYMVMHEQAAPHEEWYIPPKSGEQVTAGEEKNE